MTARRSIAAEPGIAAVPGVPPATGVATGRSITSAADPDFAGAAGAQAGAGLPVAPPADSDELAAILAAADRLLPLDADVFAAAGPAIGLQRTEVEEPGHGDHVLNPYLAPRTAPRRPAAVLIALAADAAGELCVIFTERAKTLSSHAGQIALPGGRIDPGEHPAAAALREADEEVALPPDAVRPLGLGEPYATGTGFLVVPVLAVVTRPALLVPNPGEVAAAFTVPVANALSAAHRRENSFVRDGAVRRFYEVSFAERRIWGVTAGILKLVADRLGVP